MTLRRRRLRPIVGANNSSPIANRRSDRLFGASRGMSASACKRRITARMRFSASGHKRLSRACQLASAVRSRAEFQRSNFRCWGLSRRQSRCAGPPLVAKTRHHGCSNGETYAGTQDMVPIIGHELPIRRVMHNSKSAERLRLIHRPRPFGFGALIEKSSPGFPSRPVSATEQRFVF